MVFLAFEDHRANEEKRVNPRLLWPTVIIVIHKRMLSPDHPVLRDLQAHLESRPHRHSALLDHPEHAEPTDVPVHVVHRARKAIEVSQASLDLVAIRELQEVVL